MNTNSLRLTLALLTGLLLIPITGSAQDIDLSFTVTDGVNSSVLNVGLDPTATDNRDAMDGSEMPPVAPGLDARLISDDIGVGGLGQGSLNDYRPCNGNPGCVGFQNSVQHEIRFQKGAGTAIEIQWNLPAFVTGTIEDRFGGALFSSAMSGAGSLTIPNNGVGNPQDDRAIVTLEYDIGTALPVELTGFRADLDGKDALLTWNTASESDNAGFEIQHSLDHSWQSMAFVEGHGTTTEANRYSYRVIDLEPGTHQFRLKQIDFDGTSSYSPVIEVRAEMPEAFRLYSAFPNPFNPQTTIRFAVREAQTITMNLYNAAGQQVRTLYQQTADAGEVQHVRLDATGLPSGLYLVRLSGRDIEATQQVVLLK